MIDPSSTPTPPVSSREGAMATTALPSPLLPHAQTSDRALCFTQAFSLLQWCESVKPIEEPTVDLSRAATRRAGRQSQLCTQEHTCRSPTSRRRELNGGSDWKKEGSPSFRFPCQHFGTFIVLSRVSSERDIREEDLCKVSVLVLDLLGLWAAFFHLKMFDRQYCRRSSRLLLLLLAT